MRRVSDYLVPVGTLLGVLVVWEGAARALRIPAFVMPLPSAIFREGWQWRYRFIEHTWVTLYETLGGFALSIAVGVPLAVLIIYSPAMRRALYPLIVLMQSVPKIAIAPVLLLMDEPFGALDAMTREEMSLELLRIWEERPKTILFVTHSIPEAILLADRVVVMSPRPGRIARVLTIDLPRPRTVDLEFDARFKAASDEVRGLIYARRQGRA